MTLESIWQEYRHLLNKVLTSKISNRDDVEDLLQNILIKIHKHLPDLANHNNIKAWMLTVAKSTIADHYRKQTKDSVITTSDLWYEQQSMDNELLHCLQPFIACLPQEDRELIERFDLAGESQKAYALSTNTSYSTLKSRVQKSRQLLKQQILNCCELELDHRGNALGCLSSKKICAKC